MIYINCVLTNINILKESSIFSKSCIFEEYFAKSL